MVSQLSPAEITQLATLRDEIGYIPLTALFAHMPLGVSDNDAIEQAKTRARMFNATNATLDRIATLARAGDDDAANLEAWLHLNDIHRAPCQILQRQHVCELEAAMRADPVGFLAREDAPYPYSVNEQHWGFDPSWINGLLGRSRARLADFKSSRQKDVAVLVGNGPSLRQTNLAQLTGQDVYVSNYAIKHPQLSKQARGVAVTNYFVAEQEPETFFNLPQWRVLPAGLSHVLADDDHTIWLNALGGSLFFSKTPETHIAWHATVSFFWMQFLLAVGYRKLLLIGFDNSYQQAKSLREGALIRQTEDDPNHFDPAYFRGKVWQAADTDHMAQTYVLAKAAFAEAGCEIVNCTVGGALEVFRRSTLEAELLGTGAGQK